MPKLSKQKKQPKQPKQKKVTVKKIAVKNNVNLQEGTQNGNAISQLFSKSHEAGKKALIPYVMGCYPNAELFKNILIETTNAGADLIEVGFPFSDPLADGVSIQNASEKVLAAGVNADDIFKVTASLKKQIAPLIFMTYFNVVYKYGVDKFLKKAKACGFHGAIIPDMPLEEKDEFIAKAAHTGIETIFLLAPTSTQERIRQTANAASGFIYCVSLTGVTGARSALSQDLPAFIKKVRKATSTPLAIGFGISTPQQALDACALADGAIIGSAFINEINRLTNKNISIKTVQAGKQKKSKIIAGSKNAAEKKKSISGSFKESDKELDKQFNAGVKKFIKGFRTAIDKVK